MCLGVPGEIVSLHDEHGTPMGVVAFGSVRKTVCLALVAAVPVGGWVMVHAGVAIAELDQDAAEESLRLLSEMLEPER
jgi:hydrogenase expression/formation protein HypC